MLRQLDAEQGLEKWPSLNAEYAKIWPNIMVKHAPRQILRSGRGSRTSFTTSHQVPVQETKADVAGPRGAVSRARGCCLTAWVDSDACQRQLTILN